MAWERRRNGRTYYYRKRRIGRRVVSEYVGAGFGGDLIALHQEIATEARAQAAADRAARPPDDPPLEDFAAVLAGLTRAVLLANGYHLHHRTWRRIRDKRESPTDPGA